MQLVEDWRIGKCFLITEDILGRAGLNDMTKGVRFHIRKILRVRFRARVFVYSSPKQWKLFELTCFMVFLIFLLVKYKIMLKTWLFKRMNSNDLHYRINS